MCWQSQALELEPHWISLFIWIKISLDTGSPKSEVVGNELLTQSKPEGYWDHWHGREMFRETFPPISEGQTDNQLLRQLYFFKQRKRMCIHFQDVNKPRVWLILGNKPQRKASHKIFFPSCWQNKMPVTVWRGGKKEFCLIPRPYHHFPDVTEKGLDKMWNSPPVSPSATQYLLVSFLHNKTEHHLWEC